MIVCDSLAFSYPSEAFSLRLGRFVIADGEKVALVGPSGCGKTTLMNLISGILMPQTGGIEVNGTDLATLDFRSRQRFRISTMGLVPQGFELLDYLTIRENILVPFRLSPGMHLSAERETHCDALAERAGIAGQLGKFPRQLSQGERQRAALCRGLVASPRLILADEPTGNLDPENHERIVALLLAEADRLKATVVMITHNPELMPRFDRVIDLGVILKGGTAA